ncbi:MAG: adenylosuccinate lyase, partial [bacterium]|nr:adenylosuccinate lyase [bacterium]
MISRYSRPEMARIWEPDNKFKIWLEIEILALEARANLGEIPKEIVKAVRSKAKFNTERIDKLEKELKHDVIA